MRLGVKYQEDGRILDVAGQEGWGDLKTEQFLWTSYVYRPLCKYCCVLSIAAYFYTSKTDLCVFFVSMLSIESIEKSLIRFFFFLFPYFYKLFIHAQVLQKTLSSHAVVFDM